MPSGQLWRRAIQAGSCLALLLLGSAGNGFFPFFDACAPSLIRIHGGSLSPRYQDNAILEGHIGNCSLPERSGLVVFRAGNKTLVKIAVGMPGDRFTLRPAPMSSDFAPDMPPGMPMATGGSPGMGAPGMGGGMGPFGATPDGKPADFEPPNKWNLLINDKIAVNSRHTPYRFGFRRKSMLELYVHDYGSVIPPDTYLVLGDNPAGTYDATKYGLIARKDIIATVKAASTPMTDVATSEDMVDKTTIDALASSATWNATAFTTSGANTWTNTGSVSWVYALLVAGGGGGGGADSAAFSGGGGGGGGCIIYPYLPISSGSGLTVNIGSGGTAGGGGSSSLSAGGNGGNSTIVQSSTTLLTASGGLGGAPQTASADGPAGSGGGGNCSQVGQNGFNGTGGTGGNSWGRGALGGVGAPGSNASANTGGGGGGGNGASASAVGGIGGTGYAVIWAFY